MSGSPVRTIKRLVPRRVKRTIRERRDPENAELRRLGSLPSGTAGITRLLGYPLEFPDARMFVATYSPIFRRRIYQFSPSNASPRILDCGANIGLASIYWKQTFPNADITAFEPDPSTASLLRRNLAAAGADDVTVVEAAVWTENGTIHLTQPEGDPGRLGSRIVEASTNISADNEEPVRTVRLRDCFTEPVDFLKLDIEGAETDVILDIADLLPTVGDLFVEYHGFTGRSRLVELMEPIERAGFSIYVEQEHEFAKQPFVARPEYAGMDVQLNLYCYRPPD